MLEIHSLGHSLMHAWANYEKHVHSARNKASNPNIHKLRVAIRKLEAILVLSRGAAKLKASKDFIRRLRKLRKGLGPLRNMQVESETFKKLNSDKLLLSEPRPLLKFITKKIKLMRSDNQKILLGINLKYQRTLINEIENNVLSLEEKLKPKEMQDILGHTLNKSLAALKEKIEQINPTSIQTLHKFRVKAKKFRYQKEFVNSICSIKNRNVLELKQVVTNAGEVLDQERLFRTMNKLLSKKNQSIIDEDEIDHVKLALQRFKSLKILQ